MGVHNWITVTQVNLIQDMAENINKRFYEQGLGVVSELETKKCFLKMEGDAQKTFDSILERRNKQVSLLLFVVIIDILFLKPTDSFTSKNKLYIFENNCLIQTCFFLFKD